MNTLHPATQIMLKWCDSTELQQVATELSMFNNVVFKMRRQLIKGNEF